MHTIYSAIKTLLAWLNEPQAIIEADTTAPCWADLPPYHPTDAARRPI